MANDPNAIEVLLNFLTKGEKEAKQAIASVNTAANTAAAESAKVVATTAAGGGPFEGWKQAAKDVIDVTKAMPITLDRAIDSMAQGYVRNGTQIAITKAELTEAVNLYQQMGDQIDATGKKADKAAGSMGRFTNTAFGQNMLLGIAGYTVSMTGARLAQYSQALVKPVQDYVKYAGMAQQESRAWLATTNELAQANLRIGRALATGTLPTQKAITWAAQQWATLLEKHPTLAGAVGVVSAVGTGAGRVLEVGGQALSAIASFKTLQLLMANMQQASATAAAASQASATAAQATVASAESAAVASAASAEAATAVVAAAAGGAVGGVIRGGGSVVETASILAARAQTSLALAATAANVAEESALALAAARASLQAAITTAAGATAATTTTETMAATAAMMSEATTAYAEAMVAYSAAQARAATALGVATGALEAAATSSQVAAQESAVAATASARAATVGATGATKGVVAGTVAGAAVKGGGFLAALTPLLPVVIAATFAYMLMKGFKIPGQKEDIWTSGTGAIAKILTTSASGWGGVFGGPEGAAKWGLAIGRLTGVIKTAAEVTEEAAMISQQATDDFIKYQQANLEAEVAYEKDRGKIIEDASKQRIESEKKYEEDRTEIVKDAAKARAEAEAEFIVNRADTIASVAESQAYAVTDLLRSRMRRLRDETQQESRYEEDYYTSRSQLIASTYKDEIRAEEDHQRDMLKMRLEHELTLEELLDKQDAFGILAENKRYELARLEAEKSHNVEVARRNQDLAQRLAEMDAQFALERQRRAEESAQRTADENDDLAYRMQREGEQLAERLTKMDIEQAAQLKKMDDQETEKLQKLSDNHAKEMNQITVEEADKLVEIDKNYAAEKIKRQNAFNDQLRELDSQLLGETKLKEAWYAYQTTQLENYIKEWKGRMGSLLPGYNGTQPVEGEKQSGGPVHEGLWYLHNGEYVLTKQETALWRSMLSQGPVQGANRTFTLNQNFAFRGTFTEGDKAWFKNAAKEQAYAAFVEVVNE
jgi:hypothetical protein